MAERRRLDLAHVLQDAGEQIRALLPPRIDVRVGAGWSAAPVEGEREALQRVIAGLALELAGRCGGGGLRLEILREPTGHCLDIFCTAADAADAADAPPGRGRADAAIAEVVARHGGRLEERPGGGVRLRLPVAPERRSPERLRRERLAATAGAPSGGRMPGGEETILLVDDDETLRRTGRRILERLGYRVLLAGDGAEALALFRAHAGEVALVISDLRMPGMGGLELATRLRGERAAVKVLIASGSMDPGTGDAELEGFPVIGKPWGLADFAVRVRRILDAEEN